MKNRNLLSIMGMICLLASGLSCRTPSVSGPAADSAPPEPETLAVTTNLAPPVESVAPGPTPPDTAPDAAAATETNAPAPPPAKSDDSLTGQFKTSADLLQKADDARDQQKWAEAARFYEEALKAYKKLIAKFPEWEPGISKFRITYCEDQVQEMRKKSSQPSSPAASGNPPAAAGASVPEPVAEPGRQPKARDIAATAKALLHEGKSEEARKILLDGLRKDPDNRTVRLLIGVAQCQAGNFEDAVHVLEPLVEENSTDAHAHMAVGTAYLGLGRLADARKATEQAIRCNPKMSEAHYNLAQILLAIQPPDPAAARQHYRKAVELGAPADPKFEERFKLLPGSPPPPK